MTRARTFRPLPFPPRVSPPRRRHTIKESQSRRLSVATLLSAPRQSRKSAAARWSCFCLLSPLLGGYLTQVVVKQRLECQHGSGRRLVVPECRGQLLGLSPGRVAVPVAEGHAAPRTAVRELQVDETGGRVFECAYPVAAPFAGGGVSVLLSVRLLLDRSDAAERAS